MFGITHWSWCFTYGENRWLICTSRNCKQSQSEILSKHIGTFLKISFFFRSLSHIFAIANQLPGFSINRLANVEDFLNVNIIFKCKYKCEYKRLFTQIYVCSMSLKTSFLLPHLFCNVEFELIQLLSQHNTEQSSEILILKIQMLLEFETKTNFEIIAF